MPQALASTGRVSVAVLASRVLGLLREIVFAALFGAGAVADAYTVAFRIPNLLRDLLAEGALSSAFVPTFTAALHNDGEQRAHALGNLVLSLLLVMTGVLTLAGMVWSETIVIAIARGFGGDLYRVELAARLTRVMMPILALVTLGAVWMGMLNARRRFVMPALAPAVFNVVSVLAGLAVWLVDESIERGVMLWSIGTLVAGMAQAGTQLPSLWRLGYRPHLRLRGAWSDPGVRRIARLMAPALIGLAAVQINIFVNTGFAGSLEGGAVAQLSYAFRLFFLPLGVFGVALATVTTTHVSEEAAKGDRGALARRVADSASAGWMLTSASAVGLFVLAVPVTSLIYAHGETSVADAEAIALVLQAYVAGLVPYSLVKIFAPGFYSIDRPRIPLLGSATAVAVNIGFNALTYRELGAPGIALGTALGAMANVLVLRIAFARIIGPLPAQRRATQLLGLVLANGIMGGLVWGAWWGAGELAARAGLVGWPTLVLAPTLAVIIAAGFLAYAAVLRAWGYPGADLLWSMPARLWRRVRRQAPTAAYWPRPMKKLLIVLLVLLALVVGGLLYADTRLSAMAEQHAEQEIAKALPQLSGVRVELDGFPLTFDVLVRGKVKALHVTIDSISEAGITAQDLSLDVQEISIDKDALVDQQRLVVTDIGTATAQGFVTDDEVSKAVKQTVVFSPGSVAAKFRGQDVDVKAAVVARTVVLSASLPGVPPLVFPLPSRDVLPCSPQLELLEGKLRLSCSIDELPEALARAMAQG